jgi:hypothetical protein
MKKINLKADSFCVLRGVGSFVTDVSGQRIGPIGQPNVTVYSGFGT